MGESRSRGTQALLLRQLSLALLFTACAVAQTIPHTEAETLSGKKIVLPDDFAGHIAVINMGFSRAGGDSSGRWGKQLHQELAGEKNVRIYSIAELQDAPKLVRGVIKRGMRSGVPRNEQDFFVVLYQDEDAWKKATDFSDTNDAYILLVDPSGKVLWHTHGKSPDAQSIGALKSEISKMGTQ
jgi:hypothetical protein